MAFSRLQRVKKGTLVHISVEKNVHGKVSSGKYENHEEGSFQTPSLFSRETG